MPAPRRAILADITDFKLNPKIPYKTKSGRLSSKEPIKDLQTHDLDSAQEEKQNKSELFKEKKVHESEKLILPVEKTKELEEKVLEPLLQQDVVVEKEEVQEPKEDKQEDKLVKQVKKKKAV